MSLPLWEECSWLSRPREDIDVSETETGWDSATKVVFDVDPEINEKIYLYLGSGYKLPAGALVVGQNEFLTDRLEDNAAVFALGGPVMETEVQLSAPVQTGDSCITSGGNLPCEYVIHAVAPRYDKRYLTASDQALFSAYKSSLLLAVEKNVSDLVITCIYSHRKKFPRDEAAHVALRTVRKFLQHKSIAGCLKRIMFCVPAQEDYEIYAALMIAYFPRVPSDLQYQLGLLPEQLGDDWGEIHIVDRELKVSAGPQPLTEESLQEYRNTNTHQQRISSSERTSEVIKTGTKEFLPTPISGKSGLSPTARSFSAIDDDRDAQRQMKIKQQISQMSKVDRLKLKFQRMVEEDLPLEEDWSDVAKLRLLEVIGTDLKDRAVVSLCARFMHCPRTIDLEKCQLYLMKVLEEAQLSCRPFTLIYANSAMGDEVILNADLLQALFEVLDARYRENIQKFFMLHCSFVWRMSAWMSFGPSTLGIWNDVKYANSFKELVKYLEPEQMLWPGFVVEYDKSLQT